MNLKTILAPVDFSPKSEAVAHHAAALAARFEAKLILAHVIASAPQEYLDFSERAAASRQEGAISQTRHIEGKLLGLAKSVLPGGDVRRMVLDGDPAGRIAELAQSEGVDLIVLATHGYGVWRRLLLGSVTSKILHDVSCPVLTGSHLEDVADFREAPYQRIACAVGLHDADHSEKTLRWAWDFTRACDARLSVIHVSPAIDLQTTEWLSREGTEALGRAARKEVENLLQRVGCEADLYCEGSSVRDYIGKVIGENHIDALVVGRSVSHGILGGPATNAYSLIRSAACPVISV